MRRFFVALIAVVLLGVAAPVLAEHDDPIPDKIPLSGARVDVELLADGFTTPLLGTNAPGNFKQLFVVDQVGTITAVPLEPGRFGGVPDRHTVLDIGTGGLDLLVPLGAFGPGSFDERGLLGMAFDPGYYQNGLFYTYSSEPLGPTPDFTTLADDDERAGNASLSVIREWQVDDPTGNTPVADPGSSRVLLRIEQPQFNHNGGDIAFGPDGMLYISLGDGGGADDEGPGHAPVGNGQDLSDGNVLGKVLRIDPSGSNSANGNYGVPADNPFVGTEGTDEIFAYGFRNGFRMSFDSETGDLWLADVGQNDIEEVNVVTAGGNYGWPVKEGTFLFDGNGDGPGFTTIDSPGVPADLIDPVAQYDHDEGVSVTGGFVYRGNQVRDLKGSYVFADLTQGFASGARGRLFQVDEAGELSEFVLASGPLDLFLTGFGQDRRGEVYVMGQAGVFPVGTSGQVLRLVRSDGARPTKQVELRADLSSAAEVPPSETDGTGRILVTLRPERQKVCVKLRARDLAGDVVAGHIHVGRAGENGPVAVNLAIDSARFEGCVTGVDADVLTAITRHPGDYYVNIHTTAVPSGEIRGQLGRG